MRRGNLSEFTGMIDMLQIGDDDRLLEIGYGPGDSINIICERNKHCMVTGIDFSKLMYRQASKRNKTFIKEGRAKVKLGDFRSFDFNENTYTKIYCVNVIYFWEDLEAPFRKVYELLEKGGTFGIFMVSGESLSSNDVTNTPVFSRHMIPDVKVCLEKIGFKEIEIIRNENKIVERYYIFAVKQG
jgi:cyclopropane fatty-acyl-phospholipid synthase-like methyltransferase